MYSFEPRSDGSLLVRWTESGQDFFARVVPDWRPGMIFYSNMPVLERAYEAWTTKYLSEKRLAAAADWLELLPLDRAGAKPP